MSKKNSLAINKSYFWFAKIWILPLISCLGGFCSTALSQKMPYVSKREFIKRNFNNDGKKERIVVVPSSDDRHALREKWQVYELPDTLFFAVVKNDDGDIVKAITFMGSMLRMYNEPHILGVCCDKDGKIIDLEPVDPQGSYSHFLKTNHFFRQFIGGGQEQIAKEDVQAVTRATMSCDLITDLVNMLAAVYNDLVIP